MASQTHEITNQVDELHDMDLLEIDAPLREALARAGVAAALPQLHAYGAWLGRAETYALAELANRCGPALRAFDARGRRIDQVEFHPAWHELLARLRREGVVTRPFRDAAAGRWAAWAAGFYLHGQVEAGTLCPATMTQAAIPILQHEPALWAQWGPALLAEGYDARDLPLARKASAWIGMGMTEKQGGSDVRANTTSATPEGAGGRGAAYRLRGHKWFYSAPQCDAHLVVARDAHGHSCFLVPRWRPDGSRNAVQVQRLKDKLGNRSNASSEVEFLDAYGLLLGEEGRGIPTIIEMATTTRLNCVVGSAALLRQALVQALAYARRRHAFGRALAAQPLMRSVLADLALESEAALLLLMELACAYEDEARPAARAWKRILTPAAKFWVCKRAVELIGEAMEVLGGNGYVEDGVLARLYREAPVNSIWEGSGNVMCLDVLRALAREPEAAQALFEDLAQGAAGDARLEQELAALRRELSAPTLEAQARRFTARLVLLAQGTLMRRHLPAWLADAFIDTRRDALGGRVVGALDPGALPVDALLQRALPDLP
jgi:putative acyl-CoA dehydrogenase